MQLYCLAERLGPIRGRTVHYENEIGLPKRFARQSIGEKDDRFKVRG